MFSQTLLAKCSLGDIKNPGPGERAQRANVLTTNPDGLSLIPQNTHSGNRDLALESCPLTSNMEGMVCRAGGGGGGDF